jgi:hypothetical protein
VGTFNARHCDVHPGIDWPLDHEIVLDWQVIAAVFLKKCMQVIHLPGLPGRGACTLCDCLTGGETSLAKSHSK